MFSLSILPYDDQNENIKIVEFCLSIQIELNRQTG